MAGRSRYSSEFKQEAVRLVTEQGMTPTRVARDLGVDPDTIRRWCQELASAAAATPSASANERAELARLRRENAQLRMERDILKKAVGIFSQMPE